MVNKAWLKAAGIRAIKTVAQTAVATIGTTAVINQVNWLMVVSASALAGVLSILTSVAGIQKLKQRKENKKWQNLIFMQDIVLTEKVHQVLLAS